MNAPLYFLGAAVAGFVALVSISSAPTIGAHDGGGAYVIVMGTGVFLSLLAVACVAVGVGELLERR